MIKSKSATRLTPAVNTQRSTSVIANQPKMSRCLLSVAIASSLLLVGCGDDDNEKIVLSQDVKATQFGSQGKMVFNTEELTADPD